MEEKEFLYVGHYVDTNGNYILKIGTTNNLERRKREHTRNYHKAEEHTLPPKKSFQYDWWLPLSKYNSIRYEDRNRQKWIDEDIGEFIRNDRFNCGEQCPEEVVVVIRKEYTIRLRG